jgi:hypothetical protein
VNEPISCRSDRRQQFFALTPLVGVSLQGPRQIKRQPVRRNESSCPVTGLHQRKPSMVEIRQLVGCIPLPAIGPWPRRGLARHPPWTTDASDRHDCINPYTSRSRLFLVVSALGRAALAEQYSSSLWLKCSVGKTAQRSIPGRRTASLRQPTPRAETCLRSRRA